MESKARSFLRQLLRVYFKPKVRTSPARWVEENIRLSAKTSNIAGRYSLRHTPYLRQVYEDFGNPRIRKIVLKKSAQIGATQLASNVLLYYVCNETFPLLMVMPSKELAQQFSERSLHPSLELCPVIHPFLTGNDDDLKKTDFLFTSCTLRVIGAGSPSKLSSNPAAVVIIDECDKGEDFASQGEAPALELAEDRTITFPNDKKIVVLSTPTTETTSVIHAEFLKGSQSKYFVPCPHCQAEQVLNFELGIKWPQDCKLEDGSYDLDRVEREAWYECQHCHARLTEVDKLQMVRGGQWRDTNPNPFPAEVRSYQISALYSFNVTWGSLAKMFLLAKSDPGKLRNFYNSYLGECFEQRAATLRKDDVDKLITTSPDYRRGQLLQKPLVLLMGVDTQGTNLWYGIEAVNSDGTSSIVDWGEAATFEDISAISKRRFTVAGTGEEVGLYKGLIDSGYKTTQVYDFCLKSGNLFSPVVGRQERQGLLSHVRETSALHRGYHIPLLIINDRLFKDLLYLSTIKERLHTLQVPQDADDTLKAQLTAERLATKPDKRGRLVTDWVCSNRNNHLGDCFKYIEGYKYFLAPKLDALRKRTKEQVEPAPDITEVNVVPEEPQKRYYQLRSTWGPVDSWD